MEMLLYFDNLNRRFMYKAISIFFLISFSMSGFGQIIFPSQPGLTVIPKTEIKWSANLLTWSLFRPISDTSLIKVVGAKKIKAKAATTTAITANFSCHENIFHYEVLAFFSLKQSWVLKQAQSDTLLLRHEQLHFNISELYARKIRKYLAEYKNPCGKEKEIKNFVDSLKQAERVENDIYDIQSAHSTDKIMQKKWEEKVIKEMQELKFYINASGQQKIN